MSDCKLFHPLITDNLCMGLVSILHNLRSDDVRSLFKTHDAQWLPCTPAELHENRWIVVVESDAVVAALSYLRDSPSGQCFITGICTNAQVRRRGYGRLLLRELLRIRPTSKLTVEVPRSRKSAVKFFQHFFFETRDGAFACPGGSVELILVPSII